MPINRRRFLILSGLTIPAVSALACARVERQATAQSTVNAQPVGPTGLFAPERGDVRLAVISDLNSAYGSVDYRSEVIKGIELLPAWQPDMVVCAGDMVAGQKLSLSEDEVEAMWNAFDDKILSPIRAVGLPFALTVGNHDASSYQNNGEFVFVLDRKESEKYWNGHQSDTDLAFVEAEGFPFHYSFKQKDIFYLVWDASSATVPPEQVAWADRALSSPEAQRAKLRIVMGHLPMYAVSQKRDRPGEYLNQADELRNLLIRHNVHTYISGHHHAYFPGKSISEDGTLNMLHCGALGSGPKSLLATTNTPFQTLTILDIFLGDARTAYTTYNMNTLEVVDPQSLPRLIVSPNGKELRQDISTAELTPEEHSQPYIPSEA